MPQTQQNIPLRLNLDKHPKNLSPEEVSYALNHERGREGYGGTSTPHNGNFPFGEMVQPAGENYVNGVCNSPETGEVYDWTINSSGANYIKRISDQNGLEVVYNNEYLPLSAEPKHYITPFRCKLRLDKIYDKYDNISCKNRHGKILLWTDSLNQIGCLDVEASIATDSFRTDFFNVNPDPDSLLRLCVPEPCEILQAEFVPRATVNDGLANKILDIGFKFIYRWIYYDGRKSEWSTPSTMYYQTADGCFDSVESMPRCLKLRVPIGNPQVEKIEIAFNKGDTLIEGGDNVWLSYEIIEKYKKYNSAQQYWYERDLSEVVSGSNFSEDDWSFDYFFCNDKNCNPVPTPRIFNPMPRQPQGFFTINEAEAWFNYRQGSCPIDQFEIDKFKLTLDCDTEECERENVEVKVRLVIRGSNEDTLEYVYRKGGTLGSTDDDVSDMAYYGGNNGDTETFDAVQYPFSGQRFQKARNFVAYIEGTNYYAEMKQFRASDHFVGGVEYGILNGFVATDGTSTNNNLDAVRYARSLSVGSFFYQEATFRVPKGTAGVIRIRSPYSSINTPDTSAHIIGTVYLPDLRTGSDIYSNVVSILERDVHELKFDTCEGDVSLLDALVVDSTSAAGKFIYVFSGYITDINSKPAEGLELRRISDDLLLSVTDHNGFYSFVYDKLSVTTDPVPVRIYGETDCGEFTGLQDVGFVGQLNENTQSNIQIASAVFANQFYQEVRVPVLDCDGQPIGGIRVAMTGSKYQVTDTGTGIATFKLRNYSTRDRKVTAYIMDARGCFNFDCDNNCGVCYPKTEELTLQSCFSATPSSDLYPTTNLSIDNITYQKRGLKSGGRYPFGLRVKGKCGMNWDVQELPYVDIPKAQVLGHGGFCTFSYDATGITFPEEATCVEIVRGENLNPYEVQWVVDKFEKTSDNKIRILFQSLKDYDILFGAKTNVKYNWLEGDRIEFVRNEKGEILSAADYGILNYLTVSPFHNTDASGATTADADYFNEVLIEDDGKIDFLKSGAVIEFQRSKECTVEPTYFSIGVSLPIENGVLLNPKGTFTTFDTYQQRRVISNGTLITFEHHSPSDFWGNRLSDTGKPYFKNPYGNEKRFGKNVTIASPEQFNYFGNIVKTIDGIGGDIIAMNIKDGKIIQIISETDNSLAQGADDLLRVGNDGTVRAAAPDAVISDGQPKLSGEFGCNYDDIGSILFGDGFTNWYDRRFYSYVNSNFSITKSVDDMKARTYFRHIGIQISSVNKKETNPYKKLRFFTGLNYQTGAVNITVKSLHHSGINNDTKLFASPNSTIRYDNDSEDFLDFASFTPEGYGHLVLNDEYGCAMITYLNGMPYIHPIIPVNYNEFYGIAVDRVVTATINKFKEKKVEPISFELQSEMMWFVADVTTSDPNFSSEIPPIRVKNNQHKWNASFLRNKNSRGGLYEGQKAKDYFINVTFKRDNTDALKYGTIDNQKRIKFDALSMIIFSMNLIEQSGYTSQQP